MESNNQMQILLQIFKSMVGKDHRLWFIYSEEQQNFIFQNQSFKDFFADTKFLNASDISNIIHPDDHSYVQEAYQNIESEKKNRLRFRIILKENEINLCITVISSFKYSERLFCGYLENIISEKDCEN